MCTKNWTWNKTERKSSVGKNYKLILLHVHCLFFLFLLLLLQTFHLSILCTTAENCFLCICFYAVMKIYGMCLTYFLPPISCRYFLFIFSSYKCMYLPSNNIPFVKRWCQKNVHSKSFFVILLRHRLYYSFSLLNKTHVLQCFRVQNHVFYYFILKAKSRWKIIFHS